MNRWALSCAVAVSALLLPVCTTAQPTGKPARVAILATSTESAMRGYLDSFVGAMRQLGWEQSVNIVYERRFADGDFARLASLSEELILWRPDVILATTTYVAQAVKPKTTIPIVLATSLDPVSQGLAASLSRPGGNVTGMSIVGELFHAKLVEVAAMVVPTARRIAVLFNPERVLVKGYVEGSVAAGTALGLQVVPVFAATAREIETVLGSGQCADVLVVVPDTLFVTFRSLIVQRASKARCPLVGPIGEFAQLGGLASYGVHLPATYARSAHFVDRILRGARAGDLPIEQVSRYEMVVNVKTAKSLGIVVPQATLLRADRVIE